MGRPGGSVKVKGANKRPVLVRLLQKPSFTKLGGWVPDEFLVALADRSVRRASANVDEATLQAWIIRSGGAVVPPPDELPSARSKP